MDTDRLRDALAAIASAANDGLAALAEPSETVEAPAVVEHDYHAEELERIDAQTAATVAIIEAEAAADVARIEAAAELAGDELDAATGDVLDVPTTPDELDHEADELVGDAPTESAPPLDTPADVTDVDGAIGAADAVLDALPVVDPTEPADDTPPRPVHWYKRPLWGGGR